MEWLALLLWLIIVSVALPLGLGALGQLAFGVQAPAALGGFALTVLFIALGGSDWIAWAAFGCAIVASLAVSVGAAWVVRSDRGISPLGQSGEEVMAALAGIELPLLLVGVLVNLAVALGMTAA
jgi:hypothetical protein